MQGRKPRRLEKILRNALTVSILIGFSTAYSAELNYTLRDNCQSERIVNLLPHWADEIEREYSRMVEFEKDQRDNPRHIDQWGDANMGDILFEVVDEMRVYSNECNIND